MYLFLRRIDVKVEWEEALTHREAQQVKHRDYTLKKEILERFSTKRGLALWCKGKQEL
jgi:hypothetical protein